MEEDPTPVAGSQWWADPLPNFSKVGVPDLTLGFACRRFASLRVLSLWKILVAGFDSRLQILLTSPIYHGSGPSLSHAWSPSGLAGRVSFHAAPNISSHLLFGARRASPLLGTGLLDSDDVLQVPGEGAAVLSCVGIGHLNGTLGAENVGLPVPPVLTQVDAKVGKPLGHP